MSEKKVLEQIAGVVLSVVNNPEYPGRKTRICKTYHISPGALTPEKLLRTRSDTFFRLMMALAQEVPHEKECLEMLEKIRDFTFKVAEMEDGTPEAIIKAHEGSAVGRKKSTHIKKDEK